MRAHTHTHTHTRSRGTSASDFRGKAAWVAARSPCARLRSRLRARVLSLHGCAPSTLMHKPLSPQQPSRAPSPLPQVRLLRSCLSTRTETCALQCRGVRDVPFNPKTTQSSTFFAAGVGEVRLVKACNVKVPDACIFQCTRICTLSGAQPPRILRSHGVPRRSELSIVASRATPSWPMSFLFLTRCTRMCSRMCMCFPSFLPPLR